MSESVRGSASDAARFFGLMHGNDVTQLRNFLGAHGGGGDRQLMLTPDVAALASYFATTTNARGEQVRQYDYVNELQRSTITPEQERVMREVRGAEESRKINDEKNARDLALGDNTSALNRVSDAMTRFDANNPILSKAAPAAAGIVASVVGASGVALGMVVGGFSANEHAVRTGETIGGERIGTGERILRGAATYLPGAQFIGAGVGMYDTAKAAVNGGLERAINTLNSLLNNGITATVSPVDATHAAAQAPVTR